MSFFRFSLRRRNNSKRDVSISTSVQASASEQDQDQRSLESRTPPSITDITHEVEMLTDEQRPKDVDSRLYIVINFPTCDSRITYPSSGLVAQLMINFREVCVIKIIRHWPSHNYN